jgi:acetyltransferase-like isoleucine patch superfamily enzyme
LKTIKVSTLKAAGIEVLPRAGGKRYINLPEGSRFEAPSSIKKAIFQHSIHLGAFSYMVSGFAFAARIGRYTSIGDDVQIGRQNHVMGMVSGSPAFFTPQTGMEVGTNFAGADAFHKFQPLKPKFPQRVQATHIGHDVWIGHGALIRAGVRVGHGAIVASAAVVAKDVPPYAVVAGNPAVVKKFRYPQPVRKLLVESKWWRYAPWQLAHLDMSRPRIFCQGVAELDEAEVFKPDVFVVE